MTSIQRAAALVIALGLALLLSFGIGWHLKGQSIAAAEVKTLRVEAKQTATNVVEAVAKSAKIDEAVAKTDDTVTNIKAAIKKRGITLKPKPETANDLAFNPIDPKTLAPENSNHACPGSDALVLDVGTVGMLNAARQGRPVDPAGSSDEAQSAPSTVGVAGLVDNDLEIVKLYLDLAKRHDSLVDEVEKKLQDQAR